MDENTDEMVALAQLEAIFVKYLRTVRHKVIKVLDELEDDLRKSFKEIGNKTKRKGDKDGESRYY